MTNNKTSSKKRYVTPAYSKSASLGDITGQLIYYYTYRF